MNSKVKSKKDKYGIKFKLFFSLIFILSYILLFYSKTIIKNYYWPYDKIAIYVIVPILAGIYLNEYYGFVIGLISSSIIATLTQTWNSYIYILPMALTGYFAGCIDNKSDYFFASLSIIIGQILIYLSYYLLNINFFLTFSYIALVYDFFVKFTTVILINNLFIYILDIKE